MPDAFRIHLVEKEKKMAAMYEENQQAALQKQKNTLEHHKTPPQRASPQTGHGDADAMADRDNTLTPLKKRVGVDRAFPLEPITVKKIHNNSSVSNGRKDMEASPQQHSKPLPTQPTANPASELLSGKKNKMKASKDTAWSIDSFGDNVMNFCKDLLLKAKAKEAKDRKTTTMSEIIFYECPSRNQEPPSNPQQPEVCKSDPTDGKSRKKEIGESRIPRLRRLHTDMVMNNSSDGLQRPIFTPYSCDQQISQMCCPRMAQASGNSEMDLHDGHCSEQQLSNGQKSRLPRLRRGQALEKSSNGPQEPPSKERKNKKSRRRKAHAKSNGGAQNHTKSNSAAQNLTKNSNMAQNPSKTSITSQNFMKTSSAAQSSSISEIHPPTDIKEEPAHPRKTSPSRALKGTMTGTRSSKDPFPNPREKKIESLTLIRRLAQWHSDVLITRLHDICLAIVQERGMDRELDWTTRALLHKAGETSTFVRQDVDAAMGHMVRGCTHTRIMKALLEGGMRHRNVAVRECAARHLETLVESMGAARLLCYKKEVVDSFMTAIYRMKQDASQEVRCCGQQILAILTSHPDFQKKIKSHVLQKV
ncbi:hypothetical protein JZ751_027049 [Albula glossodonta]|uniref:CLASP N-terminal domain-containing protein n=1 Tax=Albula glossodonta TaxID=121402 RepID=A0A8T2MRJ4_9TELE|nr:hypothetical protein JZ751_027049 [Albula glossodonta]